MVPLVSLPGIAFGEALISKVKGEQYPRLLFSVILGNGFLKFQDEQLPLAICSML